MKRYVRYDAYFGSIAYISEKQFKKQIKKKYILPVWDPYWQIFTETYFDSRDSISRIFYWCDDGEDYVIQDKKIIGADLNHES